MFSVLVIEDCPDMQQAIVRALENHARVTLCSTLATARDALKTRFFDVISIDAGLPDGDGFEFCAELREDPATRYLPIVFLTGKGAIVSKVAGFSIGADDYITKPVHALELRARLERLIRRSSAHTGRLRRGDLVLNAGKMRAAIMRHSGQEEALDLTTSEFRLLFHLARYPDVVFTRAQLIDLIRGQDAEVFDRTIDKHVSALRIKLKDHACYLKTVNRCGYKLSVNAQPRS